MQVENINYIEKLKHKYHARFRKNQFSSPSLVRFLQVDHSSACNLFCPQCGRIDKKTGKPRANIPKAELTVEDYQRLFPPKMAKHLERFFFCGNFGDAAASNTFLPSVEYLKQSGFKEVNLVTNGSLRTPEWWRALAHTMDSKNDFVSFSIDGLEDTNHLYRVNAKWDKLMANVQAFIGAGGTARWDMLVFAHNEHQVDEAQEFARKLGFKSFCIKKTNRFASAEQLKKKPYDSTVITKGGTYTIKAPSSEKYKGTIFSDLQKVKSKYDSWEDYVNDIKIECRFQDVGYGLFLDFEAKIWPCTWIAALPYTADKISTVQYEQIRNLYGTDFNSSRKHSLSQILNHPWFKSELVKSWSGCTSDTVPKMSLCANSCGKMFQHTSSSEKNRIFIQL